jgi:hypothetical protein
LVQAINSGLLTAGFGKELIGVVEGVTNLDLNADYFAYV